ncbi:MAG TPA: cytochrome c peroxidase [Saprospiraceae bacterium]|nr:cytochrome c peroxidase [Saprospiraceae bacterium]
MVAGCEQDDPQLVQDTTPYPLNFGAFATPNLPADNIPTVTGVQLGRMLFYEKRLSKDNSQSCASCHKQVDGFSDERKFSIGVSGLEGRRQAMPLFNLAWHQFGFFWDGRAPTLRDQALRPIQDTLEMNESLANVIAKLKDDQKYKDQFIRAFGDDNITAERIGLAIEQFEITLISNRSKYDDYLAGNVQLSESEERGRILFFSEFNPNTGAKGAECFHCHVGDNFSMHTYLNNGLDSEARFTDLGRYEITGNEEQRARFKLPSLRNVALTAPYMHDGRFQTLKEVVEHYNSGVLYSGTLDESMDHNLLPDGLQLSEQDKADIVAFLKTLTDLEFIKDERFSEPQ